MSYVRSERMCEQFNESGQFIQHTVFCFGILVLKRTNAYDFVNCHLQFLSKACLVSNTADNSETLTFWFASE